ncbi:AI-2E family transporter [soil metagenome]
MKKENNETSFIRRVLIVIGLLSAFFLLALLVHFSLDIFLMLFAGALLAIFYRGCSYWIASKINWDPNKILPIVIFLHLGLSALIVILLSPQVSEQIEILSQEIPESVRNLEEEFYSTRVGEVVERNLPDDGNMIGDTESIFQSVFDFFKISLEVLVNILIMFVFALFLAFNPDLYKKGLLMLFPKKRRERISEVWDTVNVTLFKWFIGQLVDMTCIFIMTAIALWLLDIPLVLTLSLIAFLFSFVPNIGPIISAIPAILIAFTQEPIYAVYVGLAYLGIQMFESYFITPKIQKKAIKMAPILLLSFQLIMASFAGVLGLFISTPFLASLIVIIKMLYVEDVIEKSPLEMESDRKESIV